MLTVTRNFNSTCDAFLLNKVTISLKFHEILLETKKGHNLLSKVIILLRSKYKRNVCLPVFGLVLMMITVQYVVSAAVIFSAFYLKKITKLFCCHYFCKFQTHSNTDMIKPSKLDKEVTQNQSICCKIINIIIDFRRGVGASLTTDESKFS